LKRYLLGVVALIAAVGPFAACSSSTSPTPEPTDAGDGGSKADARDADAAPDADARDEDAAPDADADAPDGAMPCSAANMVGTWVEVGSTGAVAAIVTITTDGSYTLALFAAAADAGDYYETEETGMFTVDDGIVTVTPGESTCSASDPARIGACVILANGDAVSKVLGGNVTLWAPDNNLPLPDGGHISTGCLVADKWVAASLMPVP
jgi:hypothetical protein